MATIFTSIIKVPSKLNFKLAFNLTSFNLGIHNHEHRHKQRKQRSSSRAQSLVPGLTNSTTSTGTHKKESKWRTTRIWNENGRKDFMLEIKRRSVFFFTYKLKLLIYFTINWTNFSHEFCQKRGQELLTPGMKGVLVTCNERERLCIREAYNVLNEVRFCSVDACIVSQWSQFSRPVIITYFFVNVKACSTYMLT